MDQTWWDFFPGVSRSFLNSSGTKIAGKKQKKLEKLKLITYASEDPTVQKLTRSVEERKRGTEEERKSLRKGKGAEKSEERHRSTVLWSADIAPRCTDRLYCICTMS